MFSFTTGERSTLHSAPLRIATLPDIDPSTPSAPQASAAGIGAGDVGGVGAAPPPQPAVTRPDASTAARRCRFMDLLILTRRSPRPRTVAPFVLSRKTAPRQPDSLPAPTTGRRYVHAPHAVRSNEGHQPRHRRLARGEPRSGSGTRPETVALRIGDRACAGVVTGR